MQYVGHRLQKLKREAGLISEEGIFCGGSAGIGKLQVAF